MRRCFVALAEHLGTALFALFGPGVVVAVLALGKKSLDHADLGSFALSFGVVVALGIHPDVGTISGASHHQARRACGAGGQGTLEVRAIGGGCGSADNPVSQ